MIVNLFKENTWTIQDYRPTKISISFEVTNSLIVYKARAEKNIITWYQSAIATFIWLIMFFCLDLAYSIEIFSHFCSNLGPIHIKLIKYIL